MVVPVSAQISKLRPCPTPPTLLTTHFLLVARHLRHVAPISSSSSTYCAYFPSPGGVCPSFASDFLCVSVPLWQTLSFHNDLRWTERRVGGRTFRCVFRIPIRSLDSRRESTKTPDAGHASTRLSIMPTNPLVCIDLPPLVLSLRSFRHALPLFSIVCSLFLQNTRGGVHPDPVFGLSAGVDDENFPVPEMRVSDTGRGYLRSSFLGETNSTRGAFETEN
jgi:hypothetical protein